MLSRRSFMLGQLGALVAGTYAWSDGAVFARRGKVEVVPSGPHSLARSSWPPAIVPDHIGMVDKGYICITDEVGKLAVIDLRRPSSPKSPAVVVAELDGIGKKIIDFKTVPGRAYVLVTKESDAADPKLVLVTISLVPIGSPAVTSEIVLDKFADAFSIAANSDLLCVGGTSTSGENLISIYSCGGRKGHGPESPPLSSITCQSSVSEMDLQGSSLLVLESGVKPQLELIKLIDPRTPVTQDALKLEGDFRSLARFKNIALVAGHFI